MSLADWLLVAANALGYTAAFVLAWHVCERDK